MPPTGYFRSISHRCVHSISAMVYPWMAMACRTPAPAMTQHQAENGPTSGAPGSARQTAYTKLQRYLCTVHSPPIAPPIASPLAPPSVAFRAPDWATIAHSMRLWPVHDCRYASGYRCREEGTIERGAIGSGHDSKSGEGTGTGTGTKRE